MKLRANIERGKGIFNTPFVKLTFATGRYPAPPESVITRNIGPRPWSECSFMKDGKHIVIYSK